MKSRQKLHPHRIPGTRKRRSGMSLVEVMLAISILLVTIAGTLMSQVSSMRLAATTAETSAAMADLQTCMEEVLLTPHEELAVAGSAFEADQAIAAFEDLHLEDERIVARYPNFDGTQLPELLEVNLVLTWTDHRGGARALELDCVKLR